MATRTRRPRGQRLLQAVLGIAALAALTACGGGDDALPHDPAQVSAAEIGIPDAASAHAGIEARAGLEAAGAADAQRSDFAVAAPPASDPEDDRLPTVSHGGEPDRVAVAAIRDASEAVLLKIWSSNFNSGVTDWPFSGSNWGNLNRSYVADPAVAGRAMKVFIAQGSTDPYTMGQRGLPVAGQGMKLKPVGLSATMAKLTYKVKLPANFKPALGGKLGPGLCGGACNGGGNIPNGSDGWSARVGFDAASKATIYAYLPDSVEWGTEIGKMPLTLGAWTTVAQEVRLNTVGRADGYIKAWVNGTLVIDKGGLVFRTTNALKIDGIYFDTFFGGQSAKYAAPQDTSIQFAEVAVYVQ